MDGAGLKTSAPILSRVTAWTVTASAGGRSRQRVDGVCPKVNLGSDAQNCCQRVGGEESKANLTSDSFL